LASLARDTGTSVAEAAALLLGDGTAPAVPRQAEGPATSLAQRFLVPRQPAREHQSRDEPPHHWQAQPDLGESQPLQAQPTQKLPLSADVVRPGELGRAEWNLITGTATWSRSLYEMHGWPPGTRPPAPEEFSRLVHPDDSAAVEDAFRAPADRGESGQAEYRVETAEGIRYLKALVTAVYDPLGAALILRAVVQDATAGRTAELELDAVRAKIEMERREATLRMQQAILPAPEHQFRYDRFDIAVCYQPAQSGNRVGGDWYEARAADDGAVLVTIGDVAGHGLTAAAGMARIGNALRGMTVTGQPPDVLLRWLNDLICTDEVPERVASAAVGLLDADPPRLRWAQAGHPPPVLIRDGEPRLLARPAGLLLGTVPGVGYELVTQDLAPGDRLIFYTDGLIERRDRDIDEGLIELLKAAACYQDATPAACADELADRLAPGGDDDICILVVQVR
jgi:serine phosphatase RsbU (regulator of sigma subunit)